MSWESDRGRRLPRDWHRIRRLVLQNDGYRCRVCGGRASEVDHIRRGDDHSLSNLRSLCKTCHGKKSSSEGNSRQKELKALRKRPVERHPGRSV